MNTPVCASPAPLRSTASTTNPGTATSRPPWCTRHPSGPIRTSTEPRPSRDWSTRAASAGSSRPVSSAASRALQLHQSERASSNSKAPVGISRTSGPGSVTSVTAGSSRGRRSSRAARLLSCSRLYPVTYTKSPAPGRSSARSALLRVASAPGLVTKVRSPSASTRQTTNPVSSAARGASRTSMPSVCSAARARSPKGPVPWAPA